MKKIIFMLIFVLTICFFNSVRAIVADTYTATGFCENCNSLKKGKIKPMEGGAYHGLYCGTCNRLMFLDMAQGIKTEAHKYDDNGVCKKCGYKVNNCKHEGTIRRYIPNEDRQTHRVICENCNTVISEAETCSPNQENCEKCSVKKAATFDIPTRVYYIDETGLKAVGSKEENTSVGISLANVKGAPYFSWTMSTTGSKEYNSNVNSSYSSAASDGTIRFWYIGNGFDAELEPNPKNLSGEVLIRITLKVDDVEISQNIRIIKNGAPQSSCTIYLKNNNVALNDEDLTLMIRTNYGDFSDEEVRKIRKESPDELPFYTVKEAKIEVLESLDEDILKIGNYSLEEVTDGYINGYKAKVKVFPRKIGRARLHYRLTTVYKYMNHEEEEKEREGTLIVNVLEKSQEEIDNPQENGGNPSSSSGGESPEDQDGGGGSTKNKKGASGGLAFIGVMGLLIIAIIGSKMLNRR